MVLSLFMLRIVLVLTFVYVTTWAAPAGHLEITTDQVPSRVFVDGRLVVIDSEDGRTVPASPGKHFVSLFPPRKVYLAFRKDSPEQFWDGIRKETPLGDEYQLLSSYERGAIREGTKWVYVVSDDTLPVRLSRAKVDAQYRRDSSGVLGTFVIITGLIGVGMVVSVLLAKLD